MRLWSVHPQYLDAKGLTALWREALLAQKVLDNRTKGYRFHPQLHRFRACRYPLAAISAYLTEVCTEAERRGYRFDRKKIFTQNFNDLITVTSGQIQYEWSHLLNKLKIRSPEWHQQLAAIVEPLCHPIFTIIPGEIEIWEVR